MNLRSVWFAGRRKNCARHVVLFLSTVIWLTVVILMAWGVDRIWHGMAKPKTINVFLLPGTIIAGVGRTIALLITGAALPEAPKSPSGAKPQVGPVPKMPVVGPIVVAAVPLVLLGACLYVLMNRLGVPVVAQVATHPVAQIPPDTLAGFWEQLRTMVSLCESTLNAVLQLGLQSTRSFVFVYMMICLTVRLAPFPGNARGHLVAIAAMGIIATLAGTLTPRLEATIAAAWPLLTLMVGWLFLLLMMSLAVKALVTSVRSVIKWD